MRTNILLLITSTILSLFLAEYGLNKWASNIKVYSELPKGRPYPATASSYLPITLPESMSVHHKIKEFDVLYHFNRYGYRGKYPIKIEKPKNVRRIIICGDSFTLGWGNHLEDTFVQQIHDQLSELGSPRYEVINAAHHAGYSPDSYYAYLLKEGLKLEPEVVFIVISTWNDVDDIQTNKWIRIDKRHAPTKIKTIRHYLDYRGDLLSLSWNYRFPILNQSRLFIGITNFINKQFTIRSYRKKLTRQEAWAKFKLSIKALSELSKENKFKIIYVLIPIEIQLSEENGIHEKISQFIKRTKSIVLDMKPFMNKQSYYREGHMNGLGNKIISRELTKILKSNLDL